MGQEGRAVGAAPFWCPALMEQDSAEIHYTRPPLTPPPREQATRWTMAGSGLALRSCGEGQVSRNAHPRDPSEMWSKLLLNGEAREDPSQQNQNSALLPSSPLAIALILFRTIARSQRGPQEPAVLPSRNPHPGFCRGLPSSRTPRDLLDGCIFVLSLPLPISWDKIWI